MWKGRKRFKEKVHFLWDLALICEGYLNLRYIDSRLIFYIGCTDESNFFL